MLQRAEKKLLLEMVNRESKTTEDEDNQQSRGLSAAELLEDIKFGCEAIFGNTSNNELPTQAEIDAITDRNRKENDSAGKLIGAARLTAKSVDASKQATSSSLFGGVDFQEIRRREEAKKMQNIPKNLGGIAHLWQEIQALDAKRARKSRIVNLDGHGSGYGKAAVPVLASNNYDLEKGESSVFDRELKSSQKESFSVKKKTKQAPIEHQDHCQVCGYGGSLVCCPWCPCSLHLSCVGLKTAKEFASCPHHRCSGCGLKRSDAGGLLYPCETCSLSFCEDCLPETGVTFLEKVDRFEKLGFDSTKHVVYIHCSPTCQQYSIRELGFEPNSSRKRAPCPEAMDLASHFSASYDLDRAEEAVQAKEEAEQQAKLESSTRPSRGDSGLLPGLKTSSGKPRRNDKPRRNGTGLPKQMEKVC
ncbi:MAG: hypothetical protein SGARI_004355, partial [Bacillariaceae sp.]